MSVNPQAPTAVVMIRPHQFFPNEQTAQDNHFQSQANSDDATIADGAFKQVSEMVQSLSDEGVTVHLFEDEGFETPDSVFPNNWFSTHDSGAVAIYPMYAENRRKERRSDIIAFLKNHYRVSEIIDYSPLELEQTFLEGTGAMVLDHQSRIAYAVRSKRLDESALLRFCHHFDYQPVVFDACDKDGIAVYHTNVLMCVGTEFVMICLDMIKDKQQKAAVTRQIEKSGKTIVELSESQINRFCGNALELQGTDNRLLALSKTAFDALTQAQITSLQQSVKLLPFDVSHIELAGGSVRCMLAGIHLTPR